jgi:glycosyltransferase involved in cell wall biosynthesis
MLMNGFDGVNYHRLAAPYMSLARKGHIRLAVEMNYAKKLDEEEQKKYHDHLKTEIYDLDDDNKVANTRHTIDVIHTFDESMWKEVDVLVFNRNISPTLKPEFAFQLLKKHGVKVVCDMDDTPKLNSKHLLKKAYKKMNMENCLLFNCMASDVITVTTPQLKREIHEFLGIKKRYVVAKNAIDMDDVQWSEYDGEFEEGLFGWMGGVTHYNDLKILSKGYELSKTKPQLRISGVVDGDNEWDKVKGLFDDKVQYAPPKKVHEYATLLYDAEVVLAPLVENRFNRCKSELKMLEAAALGKPVIVSNVHPYKNLIDKGRNCLAPNNNPQEWADAIDKLAEDKDYAAYLAANLKEDVLNRYNLDIENDKRIELLKSL